MSAKKTFQHREVVRNIRLGVAGVIGLCPHLVLQGNEHIDDVSAVALVCRRRKSKQLAIVIVA